MLILAIGLLQKIFFQNSATIYGPSNWSSFYVAPDSKTYALKHGPEALFPPLYRWLIQILGGDTSELSSVTELPTNSVIQDKPDSVFLKVVRTQKLFLVLSIVALAAAISKFVPAPVSVCFFMWLSYSVFLVRELDYILSETVAQALIFSLVAAYAAFLANHKPSVILALAGLCSLLVLTRAAGIFGVIFLLFGILELLWTDPGRGLKFASGSIAIFLFFFIGSNFYRYYYTGFYSNAPTLVESQVQFAIELADQEDLGFIADAEAREFLAEILMLKPLVDQEFRARSIDPAQLARFDLLQNNYYRLARPTAEKLGHNRVTARPLFRKVNSVVLWRHCFEYVKLAGQSVLYSTTVGTRIRSSNIPALFWILIGASSIAALFLRTPATTLAFACMLAHLSHLFVVAFFNQPIPRYVYLTEPLVLIACLLLFYQAIEVLSRLWPTAWRKQVYSTS